MDTMLNPRSYTVMQALDKKEILSLQQSSIYLGISPKFLMKQVRQKLIPCYCPYSNRRFFKRSDLDAWLLRKPLYLPEKAGESSTDVHR